MCYLSLELANFWDKSVATPRPHPPDIIDDVNLVYELARSYFSHVSHKSLCYNSQIHMRTGQLQ